LCEIPRFRVGQQPKLREIGLLCVFWSLFWPTLTIETNGSSQSKNCWRAGRLAEGILAAKRTGDESQVAALEAKIDEHVFSLYALTSAEIALFKSTAVK
jgi:hypothetical protein